MIQFGALMLKSFFGIVDLIAHVWSVAWWKAKSSHSVTLLKLLNFSLDCMGLKQFALKLNISDLNVFLFERSIRYFFDLLCFSQIPAFRHHRISLSFHVCHLKKLSCRLQNVSELLCRYLELWTPSIFIDIFWNCGCHWCRIIEDFIVRTTRFLICFFNFNFSMHIKLKTYCKWCFNRIVEICT